MKSDHASTRIKSDICYRGAEGSIVTVEELDKYSDFDNCPSCNSKKLMLGLLFGDIGTVVFVVCMNCNWKENITNYDNW